MSSVAFFVLLLSLQGALSSSISPMVSSARSMQLEEMASLSSSSRSSPTSIQDPPEQWFDNRVDHFDESNQATYKQRYFLNDQYFDKKAGGPIFFQIGGEGAISSAYVTELMMSHYAQTYGALQITLEHRFFGKSHPFDSMATENLKYLTSQQALADAAAFVEFIQAQYPNAGRLVIFGGSYPGALAAWFRIKFPFLAAAAVSSSSPVHAVLDMVQYLDVVDKSLAKMGGPQCDVNVRAAFAKLDNLLTTAAGRKQADADFNTCTPLTTDPLDQANFLQNIVGNFMGTVQYNREINGAPTIRDLCNQMNATADPYKNLVALTTKFLPNNSCSQVSYTVMVEQLQNLTSWGDSGVGIRQWTYMTCNEFGYFQSTDSAQQPFGVGIPLSFYTKICQDVFGLSGPHIKFTNSYYGSDHPLGATRILFVNGNVDPWHSLSVTKDLSPSLKAILIDGTAHCANMMPPQPTDPASLVQARVQTEKQIGEWLKAPWQ